MDKILVPGLHSNIGSVQERFSQTILHPLRKHTYSNTLKILPPKNMAIFHIKNSDIFSHFRL